MEIRDIIILLFIFFQASLGLLLVGRFLMNVCRGLRSKTDRREANTQV